MFCVYQQVPQSQHLEQNYNSLRESREHEMDARQKFIQNIVQYVRDTRLAKMLSSWKQQNTFTITVTKVISWFIVWLLFVYLEFGAVYFILSSMFFIYANTRSGPKTDGSPSAYSVFNPNCERIDGTFTAEQFEQELRFGAASVR